MSERGSFTTEYIYCAKCFAAASSILLGREKYLCSVMLPSWEDGHLLPIIAGKVGGTHPGQELTAFESDYILALEQVICHPLRIAVLAESGQEIFTATPGGTPA